MGRLRSSCSINKLFQCISALFFLRMKYFTSAFPLFTYDEAEARRMMAMSAAAYSSTPNLCLSRIFPFHEIWRIESGTNSQCDFLLNTCSAFIAISDEKAEIIVAFRGTTTKLQLLLETAYILAPQQDFYGMGKVQKYFNDALDVVWPSVQPILESADYRNYIVTFTGHSLGGAIASLASARTVRDGLRNSYQIKQITFGQPRVGDSTFAAMHDRLVPYSFRIVNKEDIVPHLPPCKTLGDICDPDPERKSAWHHGTEIWYPYGMGENAEYRVCSGVPFNEDSRCSDSLPDLSYTINHHRHYFDQMLSQFGKGGCVGTTVDD